MLEGGTILDEWLTNNGDKIFNDSRIFISSPFYTELRPQSESDLLHNASRQRTQGCSGLEGRNEASGSVVSGAKEGTVESEGCSGGTPNALIVEGGTKACVSNEAVGPTVREGRSCGESDIRYPRTSITHEGGAYLHVPYATATVEIGRRRDQH